MTARSSSSPDLRRSGGVGTPFTDASSPRGGDTSADASQVEASALSKPCAYPPCGKPLVMGHREGPKKFAARSYCNIVCRNAHHFAKSSTLDHWPPTKAEFEALLAKGLSNSQMADALGCSETTAVKLRRQYGLGAANPHGRHKFVKPQPVWNPRPLAQPKRTNGKFESVADWFAAGNEATKCPDAYCAPVISGSPFYSSSRRPG